MSLPKEFIEEYYKIGCKSTMFGHHLVYLSKEELIACIGYFGAKQEEDRFEHTRQLNFLTKRS